MRGSTTALGLVLASLAASEARAAEPIGPAAASTPSVVAPEATPAPAPAAAVVEAPVTAAPVAEAPVAGPAESTAVMRDPFRPDDPGVALRLAPDNTTTTTTTVVVTERVHPMPPPPPPPPRERFFVGGYGGFAGRVGPVSGRVSTFSEIRGGVLLGKRLSIGGSLVRMTKRFGRPIVGQSGREYQLGLIYGGVDVGIVAIRRGRFEMGIASLFGAGIGCVRDARAKGGECQGSREAIRLFVVDPQLFMHLNLTNWARIGLSDGYRVVARPPWPSGADFRMSSPYFGASIEFGWFRRRDT